MADLTGTPAPCPGAAVKDQPTADARAPEDAEQRVIETASTEAELRVGRDLHVVAERDPTAERRFELLAEWIGPFPVGQVARARDIASHDHARRSDANTGQLGGLGLGRLGRIAQCRLDLPRNVCGPTLGRCGASRRADDFVIVIDDHGLDLRAAEVDAAEALRHLRDDRRPSLRARLEPAIRIWRRRSYRQGERCLTTAAALAPDTQPRSHSC